jgi:N-acyl-phosphatidylethanolamine-hydrolysing phospholipase D
LDQPPKDLAVARKSAKLADDDFALLAVGQTLKLPVRKAP